MMMHFVYMVASACDDGKVRVWEIPEGGLKETMTEPKLVLKGKLSVVVSTGLLVSSTELSRNQFLLALLLSF